MTNEIYEFLRILMYLFSSAGLFYLAVIVKPAALAFSAIASQFIVRGVLLFLQANNYPNYREVSNSISTPILFFMMMLILINLWRVRKD